MTQLLDLPAELLSLILEDVGGGELRRNIFNLTVCKKWYNAAFEIFHSGRHLRDIELRGCNINRLADVGSYSSSGQRNLMHKNTRNLKVRLLGHWRDQSAEEDFKLYDDDSEGLEFGKRDREELDNDPYVFGQRTEWQALRDWQENVMRPRLSDLYEDLPHFSFLESFTFESKSGTQNNGELLQHYLEGPDISPLIVGLLNCPSLKHLSLDICSGVTDQSMHHCRLLSQLIPILETVRLRLDMLCPEIFHLDPIAIPYLGAHSIKLKSLVVKLHLPMPPNRLRDPMAVADARTMNCGDFFTVQNPDEMIKAARKFVVDLSKLRSAGTKHKEGQAGQMSSDRSDHGLQRLRISYVDDHGPNIHVIDCLTMATGHPVKGWPLSEWYAYQDEGIPWWFEELEEDLFWNEDEVSD